MSRRDLHPRRLFSLIWRFLKYLTVDTWREIDVEATQYRAENQDKSLSDALLAAFIFSLVAISIVMQETFDDEQYFLWIVNFIDDPFSPELNPFLYSLVGWLAPADGSLYEYLHETGYYRLWHLCYWALWRVLGFLIIPAVAIALHPRLRRTSMGLTFRGMRQHLWIYILLYLVVMVPVVIVSFTEEFSTYYPFYRNAHRSVFEFVVWESFYFAQFLSLEFFFRGFMLQPLRRSMGSSAIFAMTVPYVMIHIGKPILECFGAVIAGIILGSLAMRTRSIWSGVLIHVSVALSMDVLVIWQRHW